MWTNRRRTCFGAFRGAGQMPGGELRRARSEDNGERRQREHTDSTWSIITCTWIMIERPPSQSERLRDLMLDCIK